MRLNRFLTSGTISLKHYLRAFYTLLPLSCFFKDNPVWEPGSKYLPEMHPAYFAGAVAGAVAVESAGAGSS